jgi:hypothetical protein
MFKSEYHGAISVAIEILIHGNGSQRERIKAHHFI